GLADMYSSYMMESEGFGYIGFISVYNTPNSLGTSSLPGHKFKGGNVVLQLAYSEDGIIFKRSLRDDLLPKESNMMCAYLSYKISLKDEERYYISGTDEPHGYTTPGYGKISVFSMRKDGFMSLDTNKNGLIITKPLLYEGGDLKVNLKADYAFFSIKDAYGKSIQGYNFKDSVRFSGDDASHVIKFKSKKINELKGKVLTLAVRLSKGSLYSIQGNFKVLTPHEAVVQLKEGDL